MFLSNRTLPFWLFLLLTATGCLPSSCARVESRAITPDDSLSRALAAAMPIDTLDVIDSIVPERDDFQHPRTILFTGDGGLIISDSRSNMLFRLAPDGTISEETLMAGSIPYLAGVFGDSVWVFGPVNRNMHLLKAEGVIDSLDLDLGSGNERSLTWAVRTDSGFVSKVLDDDSGNYLGLHNETGELIRTVPLDGPSWRYAGLLRYHQGSVYSLVGYLPWVDIWNGIELDSMRLKGFDSPMLARSFQFQVGNTNQPPLLTASSAFAGDWMFVLNMRPGWLNIDVYDLEGTLKYIITQPDPSFSKEFYPTDLAVRQTALGTFELAVTVTEPEPRIDRYRWVMPRR